jgi:late competence protein required for DNA uptake (superfamily II DNA/RNA helicase)
MTHFSRSNVLPRKRKEATHHTAAESLSIPIPYHNPPVPIPHLSNNTKKGNTVKVTPNMYSWVMREKTKTKGKSKKKANAQLPPQSKIKKTVNKNKTKSRQPASKAD